MKPTTPSSSLSARKPGTASSLSSLPPGSALPRHLQQQQTPVPQPPPWSAKRIRPIEHHASAFQKSALESFEQELLESDSSYKMKNRYYHKNMNKHKRPNTTANSSSSVSSPRQNQNQNNNDDENGENTMNENELKIGEKEIRDKDSWQTLSTMTHHSEEAALAAIRRIFVAANLRRKKHLEAVSRRDAKAERLESAGHKVLLSLGIDPKAPTIGVPKQKPIIDPLLRCMQDTTFLADLIAIQMEQLHANNNDENNNTNNTNGRTITAGGTREEFPTVIPEEFWVFEDTPLIGSIGLDEDIVAAEERVSAHVPENQKSIHTSSLSSRVFPSRGSRCAESRVEVYYLANALDTMLQRYLQAKGVFPRYPSAAELQDREETLFDVIMCGMRELVRHNAARTIERGRVLERLRLGIESLWESRKVTLDKAQAEIRQLYDVNDPTKFVDLERLVENQALEIEQLRVSVSELKEQNEILKGMDGMLKLARDKEKAVSEYLTRQAARNVTLSRLQQQIELDMSEIENVLNEEAFENSPENAHAAMANLLRGVSQLNNTLKGNNSNDDQDQQQQLNASLSGSSNGRVGASGFAPVLDISSQDARLQRKKSFSSLARGATTASPTGSNSNSNNKRRPSSFQRKRLSRAGSMNFGVVDGVDGSAPTKNSNNNNNDDDDSQQQSSSSFARFNQNIQESEEASLRAPVDTRDFTVQCNMDRSHDREIMESTRSLLETVGTQLHVADKLTQTFFGSDISQEKDLIGHDGVEMLKELTRKTLQMEATLREAAEAPMDGPSLVNEFSTLYPASSAQHLIFNKDTLSQILNTCYEASREVHVRLNALSRHPGVVNAVDPLIPPTSPDQPCTLCGRTVLRRAEEGEDELQHAIEEIEQLTASLERSHLEKEMFKEEIMRLETRLRRKGIATMVDKETDVDPELDASSRKLGPEADRDKTEFSARAVLKAVKAFRNLIFVDGDFVQQKRKTRNRRRTLLIAGSGAIKLHKAASLFQRAGSLKRTASQSRSPNRNDSSSLLARHNSNTRALTNRSNSQHRQHHQKNNNTKHHDDHFQQIQSTESGQFLETGAFGSQVLLTSEADHELASEGHHEGSLSASNRMVSFKRDNNNNNRSFRNKSPNNNNKSASPCPQQPSSSGKKFAGTVKSVMTKHGSTNRLKQQQHSSPSPTTKPPASPAKTAPVSIKPLSWVLKSFFGAISTFAREDTNALQRSRTASILALQKTSSSPNLQRRISDVSRSSGQSGQSGSMTSHSMNPPNQSDQQQSGGTTPLPSSSAAASPQQHLQHPPKRRRTLSGTLAMMSQQMQQQSDATTTAAIPSENNNNPDDVLAASGLLPTVSDQYGSAFSFDLDQIAESVQTVEDALEEYFRNQLGTKTLVDENITAFHAAWPKYVKEDPRVMLIEKIFEGYERKSSGNKKKTATTSENDNNDDSSDFATAHGVTNTSSVNSSNQKKKKKTLSRSAQNLMLYVVASLHKNLDDTCDVYHERPGDEDSRNPSSVPLLQALSSFHSVCGSSAFFSVGVEHLIMYSSNSLYFSPARTTVATSSPMPASPSVSQNVSPKLQAPGAKTFEGAMIEKEKAANAFLSTEEARKFLPPDYQGRRILRCRLLLLAMLLEKVIAEKKLVSSTVSGFFGSMQNNFQDEKRDSMFLTALANNSPQQHQQQQRGSLFGANKQENKIFFKDALGEFSDCCGKADPIEVTTESQSFSQKYSHFLKS